MTAKHTRVAELQTRLVSVRNELRAALAEAAYLVAQDHTFLTSEGPVRLSQLFAGKRDLLMVHNMGVSCSNCTLWADAFNGVYRHISSRASLVLASPDSPEKQYAFAADRGWRFPLVSDLDKRFAAAMGFVDDAGRCLPGVSAFQLRDGAIHRVSASRFEPQDQYCPVWRLFDLFPEGADGWSAQQSYT